MHGLPGLVRNFYLENLDKLANFMPKARLDFEVTCQTISD